MIEDPPLLTLRRTFPRPTPAQVAALTGLPTGFATDAMDGRGALDASIKPIDPKVRSFCGVALPCHAGPADNLAVFGALEAARAGDVILIATDGYTATAVIGDLVLGMARNRGVAAIVTDGCVRDIPGILAVSLPCFAAGVTPNSPARNGPGTAGLPVVLGGVTVGAGDIVLGDGDGVVVVPFGLIDTVIGRVPAIREAEAALDAKVKAGLETPDFIADLFAGGRVREVE
jgi:4-hydroxy-4-methyl-2-oxoglutarate aldolase